MLSPRGCTECHHEFEGNKGEKCAWCGGESIDLGIKLPQKILMKHLKSIDLSKDCCIISLDKLNVNNGYSRYCSNISPDECGVCCIFSKDIYDADVLMERLINGKRITNAQLLELQFDGIFNRR